MTPAERSFLAALGAGCHTPVAGHCRLHDGELTLSGLVASLDGATVLRASASAPAGSAEALGVKLAEELLARGAAPLLLAAEGPRG